MKEALKDARHAIGAQGHGKLLQATSWGHTGGLSAMMFVVAA